MVKKIILYGTKECIWCGKTRQFFKDHKIKFRDIDVGEDEKAAETIIKKSGQQGVPVVEIDGKIIVGFNERKLKEILGIK